MHFETGREGEIVVGEEGRNGGYTNVGLKRKQRKTSSRYLASHGQSAKVERFAYDE